MTMSTEPPSDMALTLEFDSDELSLKQLSALVRDLAGLVSAVEPPEPYSVSWVVTSVSRASPFRIEVAPVGRLHKRQVDAQPVRDLTRLVLDGVARLMREPIRPGSFTDDALSRARDLAKMTEGSRRPQLRLRSNGTSVNVTAQVAVNVDQILEPAYRSFGTVEGRLEFINIHGNTPLFAIYDDLTDRRINCSFGAKVTLPEVASAIGRRVAVEGEISYRSTGEVVSIAATELSVFPSDDELPTIRDVLGILSA